MDRIPPSFDYCPNLTFLRNDEAKFTPFTKTLSTPDTREEMLSGFRKLVQGRARETLPFELLEKIAFRFSLPAHGRGTSKIQHLNEENTVFTPFTPQAIF